MGIFDAINAVKKIKAKDAPDSSDMEDIVRKMSSIPGLRVENHHFNNMNDEYVIFWKVKGNYPESEVNKYEKRINEILNKFSRYKFKNSVAWGNKDISGTIIVK